MWNERRQNIAIFLELLLVLLCFWGIMNIFYNRISEALKPTGFDTAHTYRIFHSILPNTSPLYIAPESDGYRTYAASMLEVKNRLKKLPEVEAVAISMHSTPHMGSNRITTLSSDSLHVQDWVMVRGVEPEFLDIFRIMDEQGSTEAFKSTLRDNKLVISKGLNEALVPNNVNPIGLELKESDGNIFGTVGGVSGDLKQNTFYWWNTSLFQLLYPTEEEFISYGDHPNLPYLEISMRIKPSADHAFKERFLKDIAPTLHNCNLIVSDIRSFAEMKSSFDAPYIKQMKNYASIVIFFAINVLLGVIGVFWYRTDQRKHEMGVRMALGDRAAALLRRYIGEGLLLLLFTIPFALPLSYGISKLGFAFRWDTMTLERFLWGFGSAYLLMMLMVILGIWIPARKAVNIPPSVVLKEE